MESVEENGVVFVRLFSGEDFFACLEVACRRHDVKRAVFLSGVGQLRDFTLGFFRKRGDYVPKDFPGVHELLSVQGNIVFQDGEYVFHVHVVVGDEKKRAFGGHLLKGTVSVTNEIVVLKTECKLSRRLNDETGLKELFFD